jgi:norsolorinic acid ketoreductase
MTDSIPGIGKGLFSTLLARPNSIVIGSVRDTSADSAKGLSSLPAGEGSKAIIVKIDSLSETDASSAVELLKTSHDITKLDVVIANSGIAKDISPVKEVRLSEVRDHFEVNTIGPIGVFQATSPLLEAANKPKFVVVSSHGGSIGDMETEPFPLSAYGASKTAINYIVRKIHFENPELIAFPIHPGYVPIYDLLAA